MSGLDFYVLSPGSPDVTDFVQWGATRTYSLFDGESVRIGDSSTHESEVESEVLDPSVLRFKDSSLHRGSRAKIVRVVGPRYIDGNSDAHGVCRVSIPSIFVEDHDMGPLNM